MNAATRRWAGIRRPPPIATAYVVVSTAIAAVAILTRAAFPVPLGILMLVTFPISLPAYAFTAMATILLDAPGKDYMAVSVVCFVAWVSLIIVQATICHFSWRDVRRHWAQRKGNRMNGAADAMTRPNG